MEIMFIILFVIAVIVACIIYISLNKQVEYYKMIAGSVNSMSVIQNMFAIMGENDKAQDKLERLNNKIIEAFSAKNSTICLFDANDYEVKASNIEAEYLEGIKKIAYENDFKDNVVKNVSKYLSTSQDKTLTYRSATERKIRSAMFSPIYYKDTYLGFWLLEDTIENAFDNIPKEELSKMKNNLGVFIESTELQSAIEHAENTDKQTGFYNNIYLYSNVRQMISNKDTSSFVMIKLSNMDNINEKYGRNVGNTLLIKIANAIKETTSSDTSLIRYSGVRLLLVIPDSNAESCIPLVERLFNRFKNESEYCNDEQVKIEPQAVIRTIKRQNNIDKEINKMVSYIDGMKEVDTIKII